MPPQRNERVCFLCCFGLKKGIDVAHFGLESGIVYEGTTLCSGLCKHVMLRFVTTSRSENGLENDDIFWFKMGSGF